LRLAEPRRSQAMLTAWTFAVFALSAVTDLRALGAAGAISIGLFRRGAIRAARRVLLAVVPLSAGLSLASWLWLRLVAAEPPPLAPFAALVARAFVIAFVTFSVLERVDLLRALAPFPTPGRLLVLTLAQIHALRLVVTESMLGLRSRLPRRPGTLDVVRGAGAVTTTLFTLSVRNARDIADAMRSRGFR
jgi:cobalt/nickel transport system permease protein